MNMILKSSGKLILCLGAALCVSACSTWAEPPEHLTMNQDVKVKFKSSEEASAECSDIHEAIKGKKNGNIKACAYRKTAEAEPVVIIPNPCEYSDVYATLLCHELGHVNQMAFGQLVDHAGWGEPTLRKAAFKSDTKPRVMKSENTLMTPKILEIKSEKADEKGDDVLEVKAAIPKLRGPIDSPMKGSIETDNKSIATPKVKSAEQHEA